MICISQHLCPQRHCILAVCFDTDISSQAEAEETILLTEQEMKLNPWCAICGSQEWHFECGVTPFKTIEEAAPHLTVIQMMNLAAADYFARKPKPN